MTVENQIMQNLSVEIPHALKTLFASFPFSSELSGKLIPKPSIPILLVKKKLSMHFLALVLFYK